MSYDESLKPSDMINHEIRNESNRGVKDSYFDLIIMFGFLFTQDMNMLI